MLSDLDEGITNKADRDEKSLKAKYPQEYNYLLKNVYPSLRRSDYDITFNIRRFTLQKAVNIYPDSTAAVINLANIALHEGDKLKAETLLKNAGDSGEAINARAVLCILKERYDEASRLLDQAERKGIDVSRNREAIRKLQNQ